MTDEKVETPRVSDKLLKAYAESTVAEDNGFSKPPVQLMAIELMELRAELERVQGENKLLLNRALVAEDVERQHASAIPYLEQRATTAEAEREKARENGGAKQAEIDRLMLEYCPDEMTPEQVARWGDAQRPVSNDIESSVEAARK